MVGFRHPEIHETRQKKYYWVQDLKKLSSRNVGTPLIKLLARRNHQNTASEDQNIRERVKTCKNPE